MYTYSTVLLSIIMFESKRYRAKPVLTGAINVIRMMASVNSV